MAAALVLLPTLSLTSFQAATADPQPAPRQSAGRESSTPSRPASDLAGGRADSRSSGVEGSRAPRPGLSLGVQTSAENGIPGQEVGLTTAAPPVDPRARYWKRKAAKRLRLLAARERRIVVLLKRLRGGDARSNGTGVSGGVKGAICSAFGAHCAEAIAVARCESGLNVYARNGDYWGLFQFGSFARSHYGFAWNAWAQSRAAYRYFLDAGWAPWECSP